MTQLIKIPTVGGTHEHPTVPFNAQETINLFPESGQDQSKSPAILRRTPGIDLELTLGGGGSVRGLYVTSRGRWFGVCAKNFYEIEADGSGGLTSTLYGTLGTSYGRVKMTDNGNQLAIADGTNITKFDLTTNTLSVVTDSDAPDTTPTVEFIDSYIFGFNPDASAIGSFQHSDVNDLDTWLATDVYTAEASPDEIVTIKAFNQKLWIFGSRSYQVYYNAGGDNSSSDNPTWAFYAGTFRDIGCGAKNSVATVNNQIFWLGASKDGQNIIWSAKGFEPFRISNRAIESKIAGYSRTDDAWGYTREYEGHHFYVITFQTGNETLVYDVTEDAWHTWAYRDTSTGIQNRHRGIDHVQFNGKSYIGDYENGNVYRLDGSVYTDNGDPIVWERIFTHLEQSKLRVTWYSLQIGFLVGSATLSGDGSDPVVQLRWSDDGGRTWGNWHDLTLGTRGEYESRVIKRLLGQSRTRTYHFRSSAPIPMSIQDDAVAEIEVGDY